MGHAIGWACVSAVILGAGVDLWNMFYLGISRRRSPLYARLALKGIHTIPMVWAYGWCWKSPVHWRVSLIGWRWFRKIGGWNHAQLVLKKRIPNAEACQPSRIPGAAHRDHEPLTPGWQNRCRRG